MKSFKFKFKNLIIIIFLVLLFYKIGKIKCRVIHLNSENLPNDIKSDKHLNYDENSVRAFLENTGRKVASFMDTDVNPCDNFYEYACGNWDTVMKHSRYEDFITPMMQTYFNLRLKIEEMLLAPIDSKESFKKFEERLKKAQKYYQSCINIDLFSKQKVPEYMDYLNVIGGFPAVDENWKSDNFNWTNMLAHVEMLGSKVIFKTEMLQTYPFIPKFKFMTKFGLENDMTKNDFKDKMNVNYMKNRSIMEYYLNMYGAKKDKIDKIINDIMNFGEKLLDKIKTKDDDEFFVTEMYLLIQYIPDFDWETYFTIYFGHEHYNNSLSIGISHENLYTNLLNIMKETEPEVIANYLALHFLHSIHFENSYPKYHHELCVTKIMQDMSFGIAEIYLEEYWDKNIQSELDEMFNEMKKSLKNLIHSAEWMNENIRNDSINKVESEIAYMGYIPDPIVKGLANIIDEMFISDNFYANNLNGLLTIHKMNIFHYLHNDTTEETHPAKVLNPLIINASYNPNKNSIQIYAGDFHAPLYDPRYPKSLKYGAIGQVIGHEMSHAFDNNCIRFMNTPEIEWTDFNNDEYLNRSMCLANQYDKFYNPEVNLRTNGNQTINENIADNGGIKVAYMSYLDYIKKSGLTEAELMTKETLPFVNLNYKQTFFVAHAQKYCATYYRKNFIATKDTKYPSHMLRVIVPLQNYVEFSKEFNCPVGSYMNPIEKCVIL